MDLSTNLDAFGLTSGCADGILQPYARQRIRTQAPEHVIRVHGGCID